MHRMLSTGFARLTCIALVAAFAVTGIAEARTTRVVHRRHAATRSAAKATPAARPADAVVADATPSLPAGIVLVGLHAWSAPSNTRTELAFSHSVTPVAPDSGRGRELILAFPGEPLPRMDGVPSLLAVRDGVVDSVEVQTMFGGSRVRFTFRDSVKFRVFVAPVEDGKPFRIVIAATGPRAAAAEDRRLAGIAQAKKRDRVRVVAVDPGHGGDDTGARGPHGVLEKRVTLAVAIALATELDKIPGIRAVLTRDGDYFVPLRERYRKAERMNADLFISIHANSSKRRGSGSGTEVYFLSMRGASDETTRDLADLENAADMVGGVPPQAEDALVNILYDVKRSSALQSSQLLAETLLDHLSADRRLEERGVKQASFAVLKSVEFPSTLVETAFINNPVEAKMLNDPEFQQQLGRQLAAGVRVYFQKAGVMLGSSDSTRGSAVPPSTPSASVTRQ